MFVGSDTEACSQDITLQIHDSAAFRSVAKYCRCSDSDRHHDLDPWQVLTIQCPEQQESLSLSMQV